MTTEPLTRKPPPRKPYIKSDDEIFFYDFVGRRIRLARHMFNMTQKDLGEAIGVRFQQIQKWECGLNLISAYRLNQISIATSKPIQWFLPCQP